MKNLFLKAKHWQLFMLMFVIPFVFQMVMMYLVIVNALTTRDPEPFFIFKYFRYFSLIGILYAGIIFGWFWSITTGLQHKIPQPIRLKLTRFKIFFFIPLVYITCIMIFIQIAVNGFIKGTTDVGFIISMVGIIVPMHLFSIFCIIHTMYFVAKTIKTVELQREVTFTDFVGEFFLAWFFPIGVWILQPQINKMVADK